jgi:hypothetical protein
MVKCWNCQHLIITYAGTPVSERLFEKELRKCPVRGVVFGSRRDITEEHECEDYREAKNKIKYEQVEAIRKQMFT